MRKIVHKLRFKEFKSEWKKIKLSNIAVINPKNSYLPDKFIYIDLESVNKGILSKKNIVNKNNAPSRAQRTVLLNDILFQTVRPYQQNNYFVKTLAELPYIASTGYALIRTTEIPYFIYTILHKKTFLNKVLDMCTGTSFPAINSNDLGTIDVKIPEKEEQEKISILLKLLDKKIELQQEKIENLKLYSESIKGKILSNSVKINCNAVWTNTTLKNILIKMNKKNKDNKITYVESINNKKGFIAQKEQFEDRNIASSNTSNYYVIEKNTFAYNPSRLDVGSLALKTNDNISIVSPLYECFTTTQNVIYMLNWFKSSLFKKETLSKFEGGVRHTLNFTNLGKINICIPDINTQSNIAKIFEILDFKVSIEEKCLEQLNLYKRHLLTNMFI